MRKALIIVFNLLLPFTFFGQGLNSHWLIGNQNLVTVPKARMFIDLSSYSLVTEYRKMPFKGTQATISDGQGNFLMSSNGVWIANATNDTMMNGSGLNPGYFVNSWDNGLVIDYGNLFLPFPGDSSKFILFHQTESTPDFPSNELFYSIVDITMDGGLGAVISKNNIAYSDSISWGIAACRHANGRDWWIITSRDSSDVIIKLLFTKSGQLFVSNQQLGYTPWAGGNAPQPTFSPDGTKFITTTYDNPIDRNSFLVISDFDRCTGMFSNTQTLQLTSGSYLWGLAFSPSGDYVYACTSNHIYQVEESSLSVDTIAYYDGFISGFPPNCCATTFWNMYLAANGKIYITSGNSVQHIHEMNYPDSAGIACDVQQHTVDLNGVLNFRSVPNHPNYYLGALAGSPCDTLGVGLNESDIEIYFSIAPNPNIGEFKISYLLPQNQNGKLEIFDVNGRKVYEMNLPEWSTMQWVSLPSGVASGVYSCVIRSGGEMVNRKVAVMRE